MSDSIVLKELYKDLQDYDVLINQKYLLEEMITQNLNELGIKGNSYSEVVVRIGGVKDKYADIYIKTEELIIRRDKVLERINNIEKIIKKARDMMKDAKELEYKVFCLRYISGDKLEDISIKLGYSLQRIKQINLKIKEKLKD